MSLLCSGACNDSPLALKHNPNSYCANHRPEELALTCPTSTPPPLLVNLYVTGRYLISQFDLIKLTLIKKCHHK